VQALPNIEESIVRRARPGQQTGDVYLENDTESGYKSMRSDEKEKGQMCVNVHQEREKNGTEAGLEREKKGRTAGSEKEHRAVPQGGGLQKVRTGLSRSTAKDGLWREGKSQVLKTVIVEE